MSLESRIANIEKTIDLKENNYVSTFSEWIKATNTGKPFILTGSLKTLLDGSDALQERLGSV